MYTFFHRSRLVSSIILLTQVIYISHNAVDHINSILSIYVIVFSPPHPRFCAEKYWFAQIFRNSKDALKTRFEKIHEKSVFSELMATTER